MTAQPFLTSGRLILTLISLEAAIGPFIADYNETHVRNPNWPPHARFHNGQTMSMGAVLGLTTLYFTWRPVFSSVHYTPRAIRDSVFSAAWIGTIYWITGISAGLYPGAKFMDPEFVGTKHDITFWGLPGQGVIFALSWVLCWVAYGLEVRRLSGLKG